MKNTMKKMMALLIAGVLLIGMTGITAFADDDTPTADTTPKGTIEVENPVTDPNAATTYYDAYRIFDMKTTGKVDNVGNYTQVAYTISPKWVNFFKSHDGQHFIVDNDTSPASLNPIIVDGVKKFINIDDHNVKEFASVVYVNAQFLNITPDATVEVAKVATSVKFEDLPLGYYMIYPRGASVYSGDYTSIVSITNTDPDGKVIQKAVWPELTKVADDISVEVGQHVTYTLGSKVPYTTSYTKYEMIFMDNPSDGLTYDGDETIVVKIGDVTLTKGEDYTVTHPEDAQPGGAGFVEFAVTINMLKNNGTADNPIMVGKYKYNDPITITYTVTVNEDAITAVEDNYATLTYNNNPLNSESKDTTPPVVTKVFSAMVRVLKVDADDNTKKLDGAKFVLRVKELKELSDNSVESHQEDIAVGKYYFFDETTKDAKWITVSDEKPEALAANKNITVAVTDTNGQTDAFKGLENGTYELIEVEAPEGYNLRTTPIEVVINGNDGNEPQLLVTSTVPNTSGTLLPGTGGMGTTIFYIIGGVLVLGAVVLLISRKRANARK